MARLGLSQRFHKRKHSLQLVHQFDQHCGLYFVDLLLYSLLPFPQGLQCSKKSCRFTIPFLVTTLPLLHLYRHLHYPLSLQRLWCLLCRQLGHLELPDLVHWPPCLFHFVLRSQTLPPKARLGTPSRASGLGLRNRGAGRFGGARPFGCKRRKMDDQAQGALGMRQSRTCAVPLMAYFAIMNGGCLDAFYSNPCAISFPVLVV